MQKFYGPVCLSDEMRIMFEKFSDKPLGTLTVPDNLRPELNRLIEEWSETYPADLLLHFDRSNLKSHMKAGEIPAGTRFQIDGKAGDGGSGVRKEWEKMKNPFGPDTVNGEIAAKVIYAFDGTEDSIDKVSADTVVRPVLSHCTIMTPAEIDESTNHEIAWRKVMDEMQEQVALAIKSPEVYVYYSAYPHDEKGIPINNLHEIAVQGKVIFYQLTDEPDDYDHYLSQVVENPTWLDVAVLANRMIECTGNSHHRFLEAVRLDSKRKTNQKDVNVYNFIMGS